VPLAGALACVVCVLVSVPAAAQVDFAGEWRARHTHEDQTDRMMPGPMLGDYTGLPLNDAGRLKARTWDASILAQPEQQAKPHPAQYSLRGGAGGPNLRITKLVDPISRDAVAYTIEGLYGGANRTIWLDGRPHPSKYAEHTFAGFSTGTWVGTSLQVTTTHMKTSFIQRNGAPVSARSTMTEFFTRHGDLLTVMTVVDDPVYFEEPMVRTSYWFLDPYLHVGPPQRFEAVDELGNRPLGWVPSYPLGTRHTGYAEQYKLPFEATQGGSRTLYPEFMKEIEAWRQAAER
jgi:hypothetical protein